ncbi:hypothetical protein U1Q18_034983 [Sarracenia purpurea var. burkii]
MTHHHIGLNEALNNQTKPMDSGCQLKAQKSFLCVLRHLQRNLQGLRVSLYNGWNDSESGFLHQSDFAYVLVHSPRRQHTCEQVVFNEFAVRFLKELEGVVDGVVAGVFENVGLVVVVDENGGSVVGGELDETEGVDGEKVADRWIGDFEKEGEKIVFILSSQ